MRSRYSEYSRTRSSCARVAMLLAASFGSAVLVTACETRPAPAPSQGQDIRTPRPTPAAPARPIEVLTVEVPGDVPAFVLHGAPGTEARIIFLHGRCTHGLGYVQAFQFAAAEHGTVIAPQGDQACGSTPFRRWSPDIDKLNSRIESALRAAGHADASSWRDMIAIGYSEGASRAEALAARFPERYSRVILIGAPTAPSATRLRGVRGAVMMAGERDAQEPMKAGTRLLLGIGIPATFMVLPDASHGQMGPEGERVMRGALGFLRTSAKGS